MTTEPTTTRRDQDWPEQIMMPGQAAAPAGPVDMYMMYVLHYGFRRDLAAFASAATATPLTDGRTWRALSARWEMFARLLHHHHTGEDTGLWPLLLERTDDAGREVLEAMEAEHAEIDPILEACAAGFARLASGPTAGGPTAAGTEEDARAALVVRLVAARESLGRHLAHEESEAIAIIQQVMSQADWDRLEKEHFARDTSFGLLLDMVPWVMYELPEPGMSKLLATAQKAQLVMWWLTRGPFARRERRAFRYGR